MRLQVKNFPDDLNRRLRMNAAGLDLTLKEAIENAVREWCGWAEKQTQHTGNRGS